MVLVGLLLILACAAFATDIVIQNTAALQVDLFGHAVTMTLGAVFIIGTGVGLLFALGVALMVDSTRRRSRVRDERAALHDHRSENAALREHNARLEEKLASERNGSTYPNESATTNTGTGTWRERRLGGRHRDHVS